MSDDDLDAMLDEAADDVLQREEGVDDLLDDVLDDVLGAAAPAPAPMQIASPARRAAMSDRERLEEALSAVLPRATATKWVETIRQDESRLRAMQQPRPLSRAYKAFYKKGKPDDHKAAPDAAAETGEKGGAQSAIPNSAKALQELILRAASKAGMRDTEGLRRAFVANEGGAMTKLQELFMTQMAGDLKRTVQTNPDFDPSRFPHTAQRILGMSSDQIADAAVPKS